MNIRTSLVALGAACVGVAHANIQFVSLDLGTGQGINYAGNGMNVFAGKLNFLDLSSNTAFKSVCGDLGNMINYGQSWNATRVLASSVSPNMGRAGHIVANAFHLPTTNDEATGLQLAVWEAVYDSGTNGGTTPDFTSGIFKCGVSGTALAKAQEYYAFVNTPGDAYYFMPNPTNAGQGQLTPVPEPATIASFGLGGLLLLRRRNRRSA